MDVHKNITLCVCNTSAGVILDEREFPHDLSKIYRRSRMYVLGLPGKVSDSWHAFDEVYQEYRGKGGSHAKEAD
ncbi:MAG: hypothetical protein OXD43_14740 [Bacteroidetes bacterium]|nr:hypothetical protein [Bacteroidota bacterium]